MLFLFIVGYLIGSVPFGLFLTKMAGYGDIRKTGSGNIGATNVLRTGNKKLAALTLLLDAAKGMIIPAILIFVFNPDATPHAELTSADIRFMSLTAGFGAILGHCLPVWLKFKGGKGVATSIGVLLIATPYTGLLVCAMWLYMAFMHKYSSLAAIVAISIAPVATIIFYHDMPSVFICAVIAVFVIIRHKDNIKRLINGTETKIGEKNRDKNANKNTNKIANEDNENSKGSKDN